MAAADRERTKARSGTPDRRQRTLTMDENIVQIDFNAASGQRRREVLFQVKDVDSLTVKRKASESGCGSVIWRQQY